MEKSISADTDMETSYIGRYRYRYRYRKFNLQCIKCAFFKWQIGLRLPGTNPILVLVFTNAKSFVFPPFFVCIDMPPCTSPQGHISTIIMLFLFLKFHICIWIDFKIISADTDMAQNWPIYRYTDNRYEIETALLKNILRVNEPSFEHGCG